MAMRVSVVLIAPLQAASTRWPRLLKARQLNPALLAFSAAASAKGVAELRRQR